MFSVLFIIVTMFSSNLFVESSTKHKSTSGWFASTTNSQWNMIPSRSNYLTTIAPIETNYLWNRQDLHQYSPLFIENNNNSNVTQTAVQQARSTKLMEPENSVEIDAEGRKKRFKKKKYYQKFMLPLLLAYKLKFFTLIPVMIGGLVLLAGATGLAGFFFALFAAVMGLKSTGHGYH